MKFRVSPALQFSLRMTPDRIRELLAPFLGRTQVSKEQIALVSQHLDLLLKWNSKMNLTSVRDPEKIVTRHFGESFFAARRLFPDSAARGLVADLGSGAGFPGIPIKIWAPALKLGLIESQQKKASFLREAIRHLALPDAEVVSVRAETLTLAADIVTLRAVERFHATLPVAARLLKPEGRLALLIGDAQVATANSLLPGLTWDEPVPIPLSRARALLIGRTQANSDVS